PAQLPITFSRSLTVLTNTASSSTCTPTLHDALPICMNDASDETNPKAPEDPQARGPEQPNGTGAEPQGEAGAEPQGEAAPEAVRSEEHTSELQSRFDLVCSLLLEKQK